MIKLVVSSLENVIELDNKKVPEALIDQILALKEKGIWFGVATGKNYNAVKDLFGKVKDDILYICCDGGVVIFRDQVVVKNPIDRLVCLGVLDGIEEKSDFWPVLYDERNACILSHSTYLQDKLSQADIKPEVLENTQAMRGNINKISIFSKKGWDEKSYNELFSKWGDKATISATNVEEAFITAHNVSKGGAIGMIQELYGISPEDTVVFGASFSDISMFNYSYFSYAMMHADAQVRNSAQHIAENVNIIIEDILRI